MLQTNHFVYFLTMWLVEIRLAVVATTTITATKAEDNKIVNFEKYFGGIKNEKNT